jgi:hypothetical protein
VEPAREIWEGWLVLEAQRLSSESDIEIMDPTQRPVCFGNEVLEVATVIRIAARFFVETRDEPGQWWMGERRPDGAVAVWGQYGSHVEAFSQH